MMFSIIEHIEYLITRHDCVVVPGWGAFIANYNVARYNESRSMYERPQRTIGFNANVNHNDGLLAQSLMRRQGMSYEEATSFIADTVTTFRQQLSMDCEVSIGRLGYFRRNKGRFIEFVPFYHANASDQFFGLADLDIQTVEAIELARAARETEEAQTTEPAVAALVPEERNIFTRKAGQIAASIAVLMGLGVLLSTPIIVDHNNQSQASMTIEVKGPQEQQLGTTVQQGVVAQPMTMFNTKPTIASVGNNAGHYYMVIASLRNKQELDSFKSSYPTLVPYMKLLNYKGLTCVYVARSDDYNTLMGLRNELPEKLRNVWIYD